MIEKHIITSDNKNIYVYDDLFNFCEKQNYYNFAKNSMFKITGSDGPLSENKKQIFSRYSEQDLNNFGLLKSTGFHQLNKKFNFLDKKIHQIRINCSNVAEDCSFHVDVENGITFLYFCNLSWRPEWSGQTLFTSQNLNEIEYCSFFVPGRVIIFDGDIPHMIIPPNVHAPTHRISFVIQYY